jgi:hypothetical protein
MQVQNLTKPGERCPACHGTGPILVSRWINQGGLFTDRRNREIPYWHPAKLFERSFFKQFGVGTPPDHCGGSCHNYWSVSAETTPGGFIAEDMTQNPTLTLASSYRRQIDAGGVPFARSCRGGSKVGQQCAVNADCPGGTCAAGQHAGILREMPRPFSGTPADWDLNVLPGYTAMKACLRNCAGGDRVGEVCEANAHCPPAGNICQPIDNAACSGTAQATIPAFFGAQGPPRPAKSQLIMPPYTAENVTFARSECVVAPDGSESCKYLVEWRDPTAGESDYHAADKYYLVANAVPNLPGQTPMTSRFCTSTNVEVIANKTLQPGSNWAMNYAANGTLQVCQKTELRLCGGYAIDSAANANDAHSPVDSRNDGDAQRATLATACANPVKVQRSGFRLHRATMRYVQTVTLKNDSAMFVAGPITYLLFNLSANATLFGGGRTSAIVPAGTPYVNVAAAGLAAGATVFLQLEFTNPTNQGITYAARVRTGAGAL